MRVLICETQIFPEVIQNESKSDPGTYHTLITGTLLNDPVCTCPGWAFRAVCNHVTTHEENRCDWLTPDLEFDALECPKCGSAIEEFELEPEVEGL